jgi:hypothetical protein
MIVEAIKCPHELYLREWVSCSTVDFPENNLAKSGDPVRVVINDLGDRRVVEDILWTEDAYCETFQRTPLERWTRTNQFRRHPRINRQRIDRSQKRRGALGAPFTHDPGNRDGRQALRRVSRVTAHRYHSCHFQLTV